MQISVFEVYNLSSYLYSELRLLNMRIWSNAINLICYLYLTFLSISRIETFIEVCFKAILVQRFNEITHMYIRASSTNIIS